MTVAANPTIPTSGLVFAYDTNNLKSYKGPAMSNLAQGIQILGTGTATGYSSTASIQDEFVPNLGTMQVYTNTIQNNYTAYSPNSTNCCPSLHGWGSFAVSPSTLYTYGIVYKCDSGYTNSNYMYRYEYTSNGGSYVTEGGVFSDVNRVSLGNGWYYAWGTFTTQATTNWLGHCGTFYYRYSQTTDRLSVAKVMIVAGNYAGIPPQYWPNSLTSRSTTQVLSDDSGSNPSVTANSLTYASDGTFSYNGTSNYITVPFNSTYFTFNNEQTIIIWMKNQSASSARRNPYNQAYGGAGTITHENDTNFNYYYGTAGTNNTPYTSHTSPFSVVVNETAQIAITRNTTQTAWYKNGALGNTQANPYGATVVTGTADLQIGAGYAGYFTGYLYIVQVYNRALTADK